MVFGYLTHATLLFVMDDGGGGESVIFSKFTAISVVSTAASLQEGPGFDSCPGHSWHWGTCSLQGSQA